MVKHSYAKFLTTIAACALLAACQTTQPQTEPEESRSSKINPEESTVASDGGKRDGSVV